MSALHALVVEEIPTAEVKTDVEQGKPFLLPTRNNPRALPDVAQIVDFLLRQGSMPT